MEKYEEAMAAYEKAVGLDPSHADGWFDLGHVYKQLHYNDKAIGAFKKFLELNKGKDTAADKKAKEELDAIGGGGKKDPKKDPPKTPPKK